jgi:hypothetical protein
MRNITLFITMLMAGLACGLAGCGGSSALVPAGLGDQAALAAPVMLEVSLDRTVSSVPSGIYVSWTRNTEPEATGYYLYRDTQPIPTPAPDNLLPEALRRNGGALIPQPPTGDHVTFSDYSPVVVGETYYYRVTVFDGLDESYPSNELSWTVNGQSVTGLDPSSAAWGDVITLSGSSFGVYNALTDQVLFAQVGGGEIAGIIEAPTDWTSTEITVTVPEFAATGVVSVVIAGTIATTDEPLVITSPQLNGLQPAQGFREQELTLEGASFGDVQGDSTVWLGSADITSAVTSWSASQIELLVPADAVSGQVHILRNGEVSNELQFTVRPEILSASTTEAQAGETVELTGRVFGDTAGRLLLDGVDELVVSTWAETSISFELSGATGSHTLVVEDAGGTASNAQPFEISEPLAVAFSGLASGTVYRFDAPPQVGVTVPADADRVELRLGETVLAESSAAPFADMLLPVTALTSGPHALYLRAYRRAVSADSEPLDISVYSLVGDLDADGNVGQSDADLLPSLLGLDSASAGFWPWLDPDGDGLVTEADQALLGFNWGNTIL